jgi:hypothetical protein
MVIVVHVAHTFQIQSGLNAAPASLLIPLTSPDASLCLLSCQFRGRPDYDAVMRYLSLDRVLPLGLAQCIGVLLGFTVFFATVLHWALLPPRYSATGLWSP